MFKVIICHIYQPEQLLCVSVSTVQTIIPAQEQKKYQDIQFDWWLYSFKSHQSKWENETKQKQLTTMAVIYQSTLYTQFTQPTLPQPTIITITVMLFISLSMSFKISKSIIYCYCLSKIKTKISQCNSQW